MNPEVNIPTLHWCGAGDIACGRHSPTPGSALYLREEWRPMTAFDGQLLTAYRGAAPSCSHCIADDSTSEAEP